jgi:DNA-binding HxlR family transcriptional regulator
LPSKNQAMARPPRDAVELALDVFRDRWSFLILREAFYGVRRYGQMQRNLGIARNILSSRLQLLVRTGILERRRYQDEPERFEYKLTEKGLALYPAVVAIMRWGDEYLCDDRPPVVLRHSCGHLADPVLVCAHCLDELDAHDVTPEPADVPALAER